MTQWLGEELGEHRTPSANVDKNLLEIHWFEILRMDNVMINDVMTNDVMINDVIIDDVMIYELVHFR